MTPTPPPHTHNERPVSLLQVLYDNAERPIGDPPANQEEHERLLKAELRKANYSQVREFDQFRQARLKEEKIMGGKNA